MKREPQKRSGGGGGGGGGVRVGRGSGRGGKVVMGKFASKKKGGWTAMRARPGKNRTH